MKKLILLSFLFSLCVSGVHSQNILISSSNKPNEPSIAIDPKHPNVLIAGANLNNCYISTDTGHTWTEKPLYSSYGVWGDPTIAVDTESNFYFFHLSNPLSGGSWIDRIVCQKTYNNGMGWSDGSYAGLNGAKMQDKQWCAIDRTNNSLYITWTQFDKYGSSNPLDKSIILFSKSVDAGTTWSAPLTISKVSGDCIDSDNTVEGATPAVGPNGEIYVSWAGPNGLIFNKSTDKGNTWLNNEIIVDSIPGGWNYKIPGIYRANGLPVTGCDLSNGPYKGTIYINWSDQKNGDSNTDIWLSKSKDGGKTWSERKRVNDDTSDKQQFLTWMSVDQKSGYLYFVFYDRRNRGGDSTDVYIAESTDGGNTFRNYLISQSAFVPDSNIFFGDYTNITAHDGIVRPIWTRLNKGQLSVWTDIRTYSKNGSGTSLYPLVSSDNLNFENYPNPAHQYTFVSFKLRNKANVSLSVFDIQGRVVSPIIKNESRDYGKYIERIDLDALNIPPGIYFIKLEIDQEVKIVRQIKM